MPIHDHDDHDDDHDDEAADLVCTPTSLLIRRPVRLMQSSDQSLVVPWLADHGLDPERLSPGLAIVCDRRRRQLRWWETHGGRAPVAHLRLRYASDDADAWPHPFPVDLLTPGAFTDPDGYVLVPGPSAPSVRADAEPRRPLGVVPTHGTSS